MVKEKEDFSFNVLSSKFDPHCDLSAASRVMNGSAPRVKMNFMFGESSDATSSCFLGFPSNINQVLVSRSPSV